MGRKIKNDNFLHDAFYMMRHKKNETVFETTDRIHEFKENP